MDANNRPTMSQSPLTMHSRKHGGQSHNISQGQLGGINNQSTAQPTIGRVTVNAGSGQMTSPIRESLIKNTGAFILDGGRANNQQSIQNQSSKQSGVEGAGQPSNYTSIRENPNGIDLSNMNIGNNYQRDRSADRATMDYSDGAYGGVNFVSNTSVNQKRAIHQSQERDALDSFMQPNIPPLQQKHIQMLTEQQQKAFITHHRAETSGVKNNQSILNKQNMRGLPSSGGTGAAIMNSMNYNQQQSSQPILQTTSKYNNQNQSKQKQYFKNANTNSGVIISGSGNGDSGSYAATRNVTTRNVLGSHENNTSHMSSPKTNSQAQSFQNKSVFIQNTTDGILSKNQQDKYGQLGQHEPQKPVKQDSYFMAKPVGIMSGTGTTEHPKGKSTSPRGTLGQSVVGLPNLKVGTSTNINKVNTRTLNEQSPKEGKENDGNIDKRLAAADKQIDDFLADNM